MILSRFDTIRIINLAYRSDRRAQMISELSRVGLKGDPRVAFFDAVRPADAGVFSSVGARGVYASHLSILKDAAAAGQSVLILEDDCDFASHITNYRSPECWDIFYGGYEAGNPDDLENSDIIGAHMMGFSVKGAREVAQYLDDLKCTGIHPPIDGAYVWFRRAHPEVPTVFARPPLGHQRSSRTDIAELAFYDRWPMLREAAGLARKIKRAAFRVAG